MCIAQFTLRPGKYCILVKHLLTLAQYLLFTQHIYLLRFFENGFHAEVFKHCHGQYPHRAKFNQRAVAFKNNDSVTTDEVNQ